MIRQIVIHIAAQQIDFILLSLHARYFEKGYFTAEIIQWYYFLFKRCCLIKLLFFCKDTIHFSQVKRTNQVTTETRERGLIVQKPADNVLIVGAPARYADLRYAAGFFSSDPVIFLRTRRKRFLIVSPLDFSHVRRILKDTDVFSFSDFPVARNSKTPACDRIIGLLKRVQARAIAVPPYFPIGLANKLVEKGIRLTVAEGSVFTEREEKTAREIKFITYAQKAAIKAMDAAFAMIAGAGIGHDRSLKTGNRPLTSEAVRDVIDRTARDFGCVCCGTIVACGRQAANPHETGWGTIKADKPIVIDIFPQHIKSGYWGDLTRTVVRGAPSSGIEKMFAAVRDAQRAAIANIKAGMAADKIHNIAVDLFKERGFYTGARNGRQVGFIHGIGHGIGLEIHENPSVRPAGGKLKAGNVITIEPGLYYPDLGSIRIEDVALVTRNGRRILAPCDYPFVV